MKLVLLFIFSCFLLGCEADPGHKKWPLDDARFVSKGVEVDFFPEVDILFVIDDSGSMLESQNKLSENIDKFVNTIFDTQFIDFHIAVTTSNILNESSVTQDGELISNLGTNFVNRHTVDAEGILKEYLKPGIQGGGIEVFFETVQKALTEPLLSTTNSGFYREEAHLLIFFLTDTDDQSDFLSPQEFYDFLLDLKRGHTEKLHFAGAYAPFFNSCSPSYESPPVLIDEFKSLINGKNFDICKGEYGKDLVKVAHAIIETVSTIYLEEVPLVSSVEILYGTQKIPHGLGVGWTYDPDNNSIYIGRELVLLPEPEGTELDIKFEAVFK